MLFRVYCPLGSWLHMLADTVFHIVTLEIAVALAKDVLDIGGSVRIWYISSFSLSLRGMTYRMTVLGSCVSLAVVF